MALKFNDKFDVTTWADSQNADDYTIRRSEWRKIEPRTNVPLALNFANADGYSKLPVPGDCLIKIYYRLWTIYNRNFSSLPNDVPDVIRGYLLSTSDYKYYTLGGNSSNKYSLLMFDPLNMGTRFSYKLGDYSFLNTELTPYYASSLTYTSYNSTGYITHEGKRYWPVPRKVSSYTGSGTLVETECSGGPIARSLTCTDAGASAHGEFDLTIPDGDGYELGLPNITYIYSSQIGYAGYKGVAMEVIYTLSDKVVS